MNFLPYIGALITIVLVAVIGLISFDSFSYALLAPAFVLLEGQFVTPTVLGRRLEINSVALQHLGNFLAAQDSAMPADKREEQAKDGQA